METHLFGSVIFGPIRSRRLGISLGVNLLPKEKKICSFDCVYCECGWTLNDNKNDELPSADIVAVELEKKLLEMKAKGELPDAITFSGNGEPTMHPEFEKIMQNTVDLRNKYAPNAKITVITNSTQLYKPHVEKALLLTDKCLLKLDSTNTNLFKLINRAAKGIELSDIMNFIEKFSGEKVIQTLFLRGKIDGQNIDNTIDKSLYDLAKFITKINAKEWMIYPIDRPTPGKELEKIQKEEMDEIAEKLKKLTSAPILVRY